jgi:lipid-binding SYLF domain-containing protein
MNTMIRILSIASLIALPLSLPGCGTNPATNINAASVNPRQLAKDSRSSLAQLCRVNSLARNLRGKAKGILVFPSVTKGGLMIGGMGGNGAAIRPDGTIRDFYQTAGLSYGLQAGIQQYGYAVFLMDDDAVRHLNNSNGWELGSSPSVVVVDQAFSSSISTTTANRGSYVFFFNQRGLMGGLGLQGSKITRIHPPQ